MDTYYKKLNIRLILTLATAALPSACNPLGSVTAVDSQFGERTSNTSSSYTWTFADASQYSLSNSSAIEIAGSTVQLKTLSIAHSTNADFNGTHSGTEYGSISLKNIDRESTALDLKTLLPNYASSLRGYWKLDGDFNDSSGNSNHATSSGSVSINTSQPLAGTGAAEFFDVGDQAVVPDANSLDISDDLSISLWIKPNALGTYYAVQPFSKWQGTTDANYVMYYFGDNLGANPSSAGRISFYATRGGVWNSISNGYYVTTDQLNTWIHVGFNYQSALGGQLYINGEKVLARNASGVLSTNTKTVQIGTSNPTNDPDYTLDEIAVWNANLSDDDFRTIYQTQGLRFNELRSDWTPQWSSLLGYWPFNASWNTTIGSANASASSGATFTTSAKVGSNAADFDGINDYATFPSLFSSSPTHASVSFWYRAEDTTPTNEPILARIFGDALYPRFFLENSTTFELQYRLDGATKTLPVTGLTSQYGFNNWNHVLLTFDVTTGAKAYMNGVLVASDTNTGTGYNSGASATEIGWDSNLVVTVGGEYYSGQVDELAIWGSTLTASEAKLIYDRQKQRFSGVYTSPVVDAGASVAWSNLNWTTELPFAKELPGEAGNETTDNYSSLNIANGLSDQLVGLWHLNESSGNTAYDSSGKGNHLSRITSTIQYSQDSPLGVGHGFTGAGGGHWSVADPADGSLDMGGNQAFTYSAWFRVRNAESYMGIFEKEGTFGGDRDGISCWVNNDLTHKCQAYLNGSSVIVDNGIVELGRWYHLAFTYDGASAPGTYKIYLDGVLKDTQTTPTYFVTDNDLPFRIGARDAPGFEWNGQLDEVAVWKRELQQSEITQLYRRGANRVRYQIRSCDDSACSDEDWLGSNNSLNHFYLSELNNCDGTSTTGRCTYGLGGLLNLTSPELLFNAFSGLSLNANRYFQYRALLESQDLGTTPTYPAVKTVTVGPTYYSTLSPSVVSSSGPTLTAALSSFSAVTSGSCSVSFQLSTNGSDWYYYNNSAWKLSTSGASDAAQSSAASAVNLGASSFINTAGPGILRFRAFLTSTGGACVLREVSANR